ncbi:MAG: CDP-alcohol phosphatidyltransferase family protein [Oscillospiraceae bacterium]|nr:CDP-alcohol phosphatidyltransferase family protein [Oscillospiraceae bacterium]
MKHAANWITGSRFVFAAGAAFAAPGSAAFWGCYLCGGLSDIFDGFVARKLHQESESGARLDSAADLAFAAALFAAAVRTGGFPLWFWVWACAVALLRLACYGIGYYKYHAFAGLHTYLNKFTGALLFAGPLLWAALGFSPAAIILGTAATLSAAEEMAVTLVSKELDRDCKGFFARRTPPAGRP